MRFGAANADCSGEWTFDRKDYSTFASTPVSQELKSKAKVCTV